MYLKVLKDHQLKTYHINLFIHQSILLYFWNSFIPILPTFVFKSCGTVPCHQVLVKSTINHFHANKPKFLPSLLDSKRNHELHMHFDSFFIFKIFLFSNFRWFYISLDVYIFSYEVSWSFSSSYFSISSSFCWFHQLLNRWYFFLVYLLYKYLI